MIHESIIFASEAHNGQLRKGTQLPYIIHPLEVAQILSSAHASKEAIVAGILHDTLEDTNVTCYDLTCRFGTEVTSLVTACSNFCTGSWRIRKQNTITKLETTQNQNVALILCADKISNLRSIVYDIKAVNQKIWDRFSAPKEDILWYYEQLGTVISKKPDLPKCLTHEFTSLYQTLQSMTQGDCIRQR